MRFRKWLMRRDIWACVLMPLFFSCSWDDDEKLTYRTPKYVVLKLDDLWFEGDPVHEGWVKTIAYLNSKNIVTTIGLVGDSLEEADESYLAWIKARDAEGHEIWNHGYCHCQSDSGDKDDPRKSEFFKSSFSAQVENLQKTQELALEKLGIQLVSFGAPYNWVDTTTAAALQQFPEIKIWIYGDALMETDKLVLSRHEGIGIEYPVHKPNYAKFTREFAKYSGGDVLVLQGHPRGWVEEATRWGNFVKIIEHLEAKAVRFITARDYERLKNPSPSFKES